MYSNLSYNTPYICSQVLLAYNFDNVKVALLINYINSYNSYLVRYFKMNSLILYIVGNRPDIKYLNRYVRGKLCGACEENPEA